MSLEPDATIETDDVQISSSYDIDGYADTWYSNTFKSSVKSLQGNIYSQRTGKGWEFDNYNET
jgi:hypothetical protein